jgi:metallopeptidase MepB
MAPSQLRKPPQAPPVFTATPGSVIEETKKFIDVSRKLTDDIVSRVKEQDASFETVVLPLAHDENKQGLVAHILGFYQSVSTNQELRDASTEAEKLMDDFSIEASMREDVYKLVDAALKKVEKLDPESQRLLEKEHKSYIRNGLNIEAGPKRDRFKEIKKRLSQLSIIFQKNLNEEKGGLWLAPEELNGVSEDVLSGLKKEDGKYWLTFKYPDLFPVLKYGTNSATRMCHCSEKPSYYEMRLLDYWTIQTMLPSSWRIKWPKLPRRWTISSRICEHDLVMVECQRLRR